MDSKYYFKTNPGYYSNIKHDIDSKINIKKKIYKQIKQKKKKRISFEWSNKKLFLWHKFIQI
jgi:hypothetical protein